MARPDPAAVRRALEKRLPDHPAILGLPEADDRRVHGYCLGSAMELAMACDLTIAADDCRFGEPEVKFGSGIVALLLPWLDRAEAGQIPAADRRRSGERGRSAVASASSIASCRRLSSCDEALALARRIAANDALAVRMTKQAINRSLDIGGMRQAMLNALEIDITVEISETAESREFNEILKRDGAKAAIAWRAGKNP